MQTSVREGSPLVKLRNSALASPFESWSPFSSAPINRASPFEPGSRGKDLPHVHGMRLKQGSTQSAYLLRHEPAAANEGIPIGAIWAIPSLRLSTDRRLQRPSNSCAIRIRPSAVRYSASSARPLALVIERRVGSLPFGEALLEASEKAEQLAVEGVDRRSCRMTRLAVQPSEPRLPATVRQVIASSPSGSSVRCIQDIWPPMAATIR